MYVPHVFVQKYTCVFVVHEVLIPMLCRCALSYTFAVM